MADILFYPPLPNRPQLYDQLFRSIWHFLPALDKLGRLIFPYGGDDFALVDTGTILDMARIYISRDLDPAIADFAPRYAGKIALPPSPSRAPADYIAAYPRLKGVIVWSCDAQTVVAAHAIAAATGADLRLDHPRAGLRQFGGQQPTDADADTRRDRHAVACQQFLGVVFV